MEIISTEFVRQQLNDACADLESCIHEFRVLCGTNDWKEHIINITDEFTDIFPDIMAKVIFPNKKTGNRTIMIKAKAGSKINLHKMLPLRFVYVVHGDQRDETGVIVLNEDESMIIQTLEESSMYFKIDTKLIMEFEEDEAA